jgi:hypothetical protein
MPDVDITDGNASPDEVEFDVDMLCTLMLNRVGGEVDGTDVITVDGSALQQQSMEVLEELPKTTSFSHTVGHGVILNLDTRAEDDVLVLVGLGDEVVTEKHSIT